MITTERSPNGFVHQIEIAAPLTAVHEFLADLEAHAELHPLIESVERIEPVSGLPNARHHRVVDRITVGPLRVRVTYTAALATLSETEIRADAWQRPGIHLQTTYSLSETGSSTALVERVIVDAPALLRRFTVGQACAAHRETLGKLKVRLEAD